MLSTGIAILIFGMFSPAIAPFPWGAILIVTAVPSGVVIIIRNIRIGRKARTGRGGVAHHCVNCNQSITPQRHMSGGKKLAAAILSALIFMFGIYATISTFIGGAIYGGTGPSDTFATFAFFLMISIAIPIALYGTSPKSCPICKTPTR